MDKSQLIEEAIEALRDFEVGREQLNERSAMTLLALLQLKPGDDWARATNPMLGTRAIMDWIRDQYGVEYAANTRETIRRFTLHQFVIAQLVEENADRPDRPINSPKWNYRVTDEALEVLRHYREPRFESEIERFLSDHLSYRSLVEERRHMPKTPVHLPSGQELELSPSGQSVLIKAMVEEMLPRFAPGCQVAFIDDTDHKHGVIDADLLDDLGISLKAREKAPDVIAWDERRGWLFLMEAASTHGPVDVTRKNELHDLFADQWNDAVLVSCFPDRRTMQRYLAQLAWETEAWCADTPGSYDALQRIQVHGPIRTLIRRGVRRGNDHVSGLRNQYLRQGLDMPVLRLCGERSGHADSGPIHRIRSGPAHQDEHRTLGSQVSFSDGGNVGDANPGKKGRGKMAGVFEGLGVSASRRSRPSGLRQGIPRR